MMELDCKVDDVLKFLDYTNEKGFLPKATISNHKAAFSKLMSILSPEETTIEFLTKNLESVKGRYRNLRQDLTASTLDEYGRRVNQAVGDYRAWKQDPTQWEAAAGAKSRKQREPARKKEHAGGAKSLETTPRTAPTEDSQTFRKVVIPLRPGFDAEILVPQDLLTREEHLKIGVGLLTFCKDFGDFAPERSQWPMPITRE